MLKKRVIPIVLLDGFSVLKTINFDVRRNLGSPVTVMRTYNTRNVDEMIILDIDASKYDRPIDKFIIKEISSDCFMPLTIGGGIKTCNDIESLLKSGADKVSINSYSYKNPSFIKEAAENFGSQCIVASVDCIKEGDSFFPYCNKDVLYDINLFDWLLTLQDLGAGEILINDVSKDGTMSGCNIHLAKSVTNILKVPVIFSGGVDSAENVAELIKDGGVDAAGVSSIFHFTEITPNDCRKALKDIGIPAR
jgi:cyclase|tara:strand:+ start:404 stop:1153 length:750 start_codon:yes stop_codon:yes gene_type:complete